MEATNYFYYSCIQEQKATRGLFKQKLAGPRQQGLLIFDHGARTTFLPSVAPLTAP